MPSWITTSSLVVASCTPWKRSLPPCFDSWCSLIMGIITIDQLTYHDPKGPVSPENVLPAVEGSLSTVHSIRPNHHLGKDTYTVIHTHIGIRHIQIIHHIRCIALSRQRRGRKKHTSQMAAAPWPDAKVIHLVCKAYQPPSWNSTSTWLSAGGLNRPSKGVL